jgi:hypothetical protein
MAWRTRIWVLAALPVVVDVAMPWILLAIFSGRLPERAYVDGWSRTGPDYAHLAPTWQEWAAKHLFILPVACLVVAILLARRRVPRLLRIVVAVSWAFWVQDMAKVIIDLVTVVDVTGYPAQPTPWWADAASAVIGLVGAGVAWALVGRLPAMPDATGGLPAGAPRRDLRPTERVVFFESVRSVKAAILGCVVVVLAIVLDVNAMPFVVLGVAMLLQAWAKVLIDSEGVLLDLPLMRVRQRVSYREIEYAQAVDQSYARGWWPLMEDSKRFGYAGHRGEHMVLRLSDKREFVVNLSAATTAAALVNGEIARRRELAC